MGEKRAWGTAVIRLHIVTEGQTEQRFIDDVLAPHLATFSIFATARSVLTSKDTRTSRPYRGGLKNYSKAKKDILSWLQEDNHAECRFSTMFDLYALPNDFPGYEQARHKENPYEKVKMLEERLATDISDERFIPYIQLHEFEALILADPQQLNWEYLEHDTPINNLISMVGDRNPELINDSQNTAPSKRILKEIPEYNKATAGPAVTKRIGVQKLRERCLHFGEWVLRLECLAGDAP